MNKMVVTSIVTLLLGLLASFHVALPATVNATTIVGFVMVLGSTALVVFRFYHDGESPADAKSPWASKTVWTGLVGALFGGLAFLGIAPSVDQSSLVEVALAVVSAAGIVFGGTARSSLS